MAEIHADMTIDEVLEVKPHAKEIFFEYGVFSENAAVQSMETVREACESHGMDEDKINELMAKLESL
ncbi:DUF1858 domain-containing protein [candidate division KSB1 bacterium]